MAAPTFPGSPAIWQTRSVELGQQSPFIRMAVPVSSRRTLMVSPPLPMMAPHIDLWISIRTSVNSSFLRFAIWLISCWSFSPISWTQFTTPSSSSPRMWTRRSGHRLSGMLRLTPCVVLSAEATDPLFPINLPPSFVGINSLTVYRFSVVSRLLLSPLLNSGARRFDIFSLLQITIHNKYSGNVRNKCCGNGNWILGVLRGIERDAAGMERMWHRENREAGSSWSLTDWKNL